jgi:hypothetical protein
MNKKLEPQMENALDIVKRAIFKEIIKLTPLKRFIIISFNP